MGKWSLRDLLSSIFLVFNQSGRFAVMKMKLNICLFFVFAIGMAGCVDIPDFGDIPEIEYNSITQDTRTDTVGGAARKYEFVTVTIDFWDGDGDLGISKDDLQDSVYRAQYPKIPNWGLEGNYELVTMQLDEDGKTWREFIIGLDGPKWFYDLKPDGKPGPIKGKLDLHIRNYYSPKGNTTMVTRKYKIRIIDRAFRISNQTKESDEIIVPAYE